ncbi:MAG TPA: glycosyltransferase [Thermoplasmata archaeon]|nr:glycosyltransferase [Thermoplasmata archaeon]
MGILSVTVIVTVLDDPRLARALDSLRAQRRPPDVVLIADGGRSPEIAAICERYRAADPRFVHLSAPGSITESRNQAIRSITTDLIAFLDTDEVAPPEWLGALIGPLLADERIGFTGGPTPALAETARNRSAQYYNAYLRRFYEEVVRSRPWAIPMGNSAWRKRLFDELGPLVAALPTNGAEDQEFENRAVQRGWKSAYVPEAFVYHDYTELDLGSLLRRQYRYASGAYVVWRTHGTTYEASHADLVYLALPAGAVLGAILLLLPGSLFVLAGFVLLGATAVGFAALEVRLAIQGARAEPAYPGYRYRPWIEPLRKWATMLGALSGMLDRKKSTAADPPTSPSQR